MREASYLFLGFFSFFTFFDKGCTSWFFEFRGKGRKEGWMMSDDDVLFFFFLIFRFLFSPSEELLCFCFFYRQFAIDRCFFKLLTVTCLT